MHKSAMQMQHARDMQRGVSSVGGNLSVMGAEVKPHQCQQCLKSFSSNHQLVQHIRVHTGIAQVYSGKILSFSLLVLYFR